MIKNNILTKLNEYKIGLARGTVDFAPSTPNFVKAYQFLAHLLTISVGNIETHHIGSTAVEGLIAKPLIDILLIYKNRSDFLRQVPKIETLGFTFKGEVVQVKDGLAFTYYNAEETIDYAHIHAFPAGHPTITDLLTFRDKLRASPKLVKDYAELKQALKAAGISRKDYPYAKTEWISKMIGK